MRSHCVSGIVPIRRRHEAEYLEQWEGLQAQSFRP
eukprot:COSAG02_NODE_59403_length_274_cov_0.874286_1_plen_34_part_10